MEKRIGLFGGSFNPIHMGHLVIAEAAWQEFGLSKVIFIPTGDTPGKTMHRISKEDRYHMTALAIKGNPKFVISDIEMRRSGPSYTVDTIRELRQMALPGTEFYFIAGTDAVAELPTWKYNHELLESCHFICASRPSDQHKVKRAVEHFGKLGREKIHFLRTPELEISSTILREMIHQGRSPRYLMPDAVISWLEERKLYREAEE